ncbi:MAG: BamA/TamA family outer membrane protein [Legionellales bacterium]|nr:BamA/TamA family outer membrane protein [Legionellales bacterium]
MGKTIITQLKNAIIEWRILISHFLQTILTKKQTSWLLITSGIVIFFFSVFLPASATSIQLINHIEGLQDPLLKNVSKSLTVIQNSHGNPVDVDLIQYWYEHSNKAIKIALQPYGYFTPHITSHLQRISPNLYHANFTIDPGVPTIIREIQVKISGEGANLALWQRLRARLPIKVGEVFNSENYEKSKQLLSDAANRRGFLHAKFHVSEVQVNTDTHTAVIVLQFDTGIRYYFGDFHFQQSAYSERFLRRFIWLKPGDPYSPSEVTRLQQNLVNSGFFQQVNVTPEEINPNQPIIPVNIQLAPLAARQYLIGGGYGTDTGIRGTLGINFRRVTKTGQQFKGLIQGSQKNSSLITEYTIPGNDPLTERYAISGVVENSRPQSFQNRVKKISVSYITSPTYWQRTIALSYQQDINQNADFINRHTHSLYPSLTYFYLNARDPIYSPNGSKISISTLAGAQYLGSSTSFAQIQTMGKLIISPWDGTRFLFRGNLGFTAVKDSRNLPLSMRFFAGGTNSVRGYGFEDLGPGTFLLIGSAEAQQRIYGKWYISTFLDSGNAIDHFPKLNDLKRAVGAGLVFVTPVGPIELSLAKPIHDPFNKKWRLQFTVGPDL